MNIFLASCTADEIRRATEADLIDGVAISDAAVLSDDPAADSRERIEEITREFALPTCVTVGAIATDDIYREARDLAKISDHIVVQIPFVEDAIIPMRKLTAEGISVCVTFVYNGAQAVIAAKTGVPMVSVALDDMENDGQCCADVVREIRASLDASDVECDLLVSAPRNAMQFTDSLLGGANTIIVSAPTLSALMVHSRTDRALVRYLRDVGRRRKLRGAL